MPRIFTHAAVTLALPAAADRGRIAASMLPDLDRITCFLHMPYAEAFGHRGASHWLRFAAAPGAIGAALQRPLRARPLQAATGRCVCSAAHPLLEATTCGGLGVALAWPWREQRWFARWRPIRVSSFANGLFGARGVATVLSELRWVWLPLAAAVGAWKLPQPPPSPTSRSLP
jgi:inner membrane protein